MNETKPQTGGFWNDMMLRFSTRRGLRWVAGLLFMTRTVTACESAQVEVRTGLPDYDPALAKRLVEEQGALILDVRTPREFQSGHLPQAHNIEISQLPSRLDEVRRLVHGDTSHPIVVYCAAGVRAAKAKRILLQAGFSRVTNLGGLRDWPH
jgi:rhodanese-related sulfurtransferase